MKFRFLLVLLSLFYLLCCESSSLPQEKPTLVAEIDLVYNGTERRVFVFRAFSSATVNDALFIRAQQDDPFATHVFDRYDSLANFTIDGDFLNLFLLDRDRSVKNIDTITVPIMEIFR